MEADAINIVDEEIYSCLDLDNPKSFFLFAGAGSGKTRTLVEVLKRFREQNGQRLRLSGQHVAIITYTNAACDEIVRRLEYDSAFIVSTIHSFSWQLIQPYQNDIKGWLRIHLEEDIKELEDKQVKGRPGTKAAIDRERKIESNKKRVEALDSVKKFTYNPNGDNTTRDSLNHAEIINIAADFLLHRPLMQKILMRKFPILLIDESQDTKKELLEAFFHIQANHPSSFSLGLFGDTMQRIYTDGKIDLGRNVPDTWAKPAIASNFRCPKRVITLINKIRSQADNQTQEPVDTKEEGFVRLFIVDANVDYEKAEIESAVAREMAKITGDDLWDDQDEGVKILTLEHHMAARRGGFSEFFDSLYAVDKLKTGLLDGNLSGIPFFVKQVRPLINACRTQDKFSIAQLVREHSPILQRDKFINSQAPLEQIRKANSAVGSLFSLWDDKKDPTLLEILRKVAEEDLFKIPDTLRLIANRAEITEEDLKSNSEDEETDRDVVIDAWDNALNSSFSQLDAYADYISDKSRFGTHQGIKGLEFPRVMIILDDEEARGFLFSYDKLFGAKELSPTDVKNEAEGKETSIDRTRRLFYVTCSRAEKSLAIIAYTSDPEKVKQHAIEQGWFHGDEVVTDVVANGIATK